jgi:hypothetical protein
MVAENIRHKIFIDDVIGTNGQVQILLFIVSNRDLVQELSIPIFTN